MFGTAQPALLSFPEERPVFLREYSTNHYGVIPYFMSRLTVEVVVTGAQIFLQVVITYFMVGFNSNFGLFYLTVYALAMASTALAVTLGCSVEDPKLAQELLPLLFVPQMLFSGFFVVPELIPVWLRWAQYLCSLTYAVRIAAVEEFGDREGCESCAGFLDTLGADPDGVWWNWLVLAALFAVFRLLALAVLRRKAEKFF
jgi:ABC-type multidrug transport system permease subunit